METDNIYIANITTLFSDHYEHTEKYEAARRAGCFSAVEAQNPYQNTISEWQRAIKEFKLPFVLINTPVLCSSSPASVSSSVSSASTTPTVTQDVPAWNGPPISDEVQQRIQKELDFNLKTTIGYCRLLKPKKVHVILGDAKTDQEFALMKSLLRHSVEKLTTVFPELVCVIEPLSIKAHYYLRSYDTAIEIVQEINHPNLKIMLDTFHLQRLHGQSGGEDDTKMMQEYIERLAPFIGHVQISQAPNRDSPMNEGQVCFKTIIPAIKKVYSGPIGLEYFGETNDDFKEVVDYLNAL